MKTKTLSISFFWHIWKRRYEANQKTRSEEGQADHKEHFILPLVRHLNKTVFPGWKVKVMGPQGICCRYWITFTKGRKKRHINLEPDLERGGLDIRDFSRPSETTHLYSPQSIGALNGLQYAADYVEPSTPVADLVRFFKP